MSNIFEKLLSSSARRRLRREINNGIIDNRRRVDRELPRPAIGDQHIRNCRLLVDRQELLSLLPKQGIVAELGVDHGDFSEQILRINQPKKLHLVDNWGSDRYDDTLFKLVKTKFQSELTAGQLAVHRQLSVKAAQEFSNAYFDWIYIDTDHSYLTTKAELEAYADKIKLGGIIAGHDFVKGNWIKGLRYGVMEAVHEFCLAQNWELLYVTATLTEFNSFAIRRIDS